MPRRRSRQGHAGSVGCYHENCLSYLHIVGFEFWSLIPTGLCQLEFWIPSMKKIRRTQVALRSLIVTEIALLLYLAIAAPLANAQSLPAVRISFSAPSGLSIPAWMAKELGLFEKYGLNGSIIYIGGGTLPISVLLAGDTEFTMVVGPPAVLARLNGADSTILATFANRL